jgi:hypothetical protein
MTRRLWITASLLPALACGLAPEGVACTASVEPAVVIEIRDARTGAPLAGSAGGVVRDGTFADSLRPYESTGVEPGPAGLYSRRGADERPGTYAVEVRAAGYAVWTVSGVRASRGVCHVRTQRIRASLAPAG